MDTRFRPDTSFRIDLDGGALNADYDWVDEPTVRVGGCDCCSTTYLLSALTSDELSVIHDALVLDARRIMEMLTERRR